MNEVDVEINNIFNKLPFNSYEDLFKAIKNNKANFKFNQSTCSQLASVKHPLFGSLGNLLGFVVTTILLVIYSIYFNFYWDLLLIPFNLVLSYLIIFLPKLKTIAWIVLIVDLFFIQLNSFFLIFAIDIILLYFFYNLWWNKICKYSFKELEYNKEAFLWAWNRNGLAIEDNYGNTYFKYKIDNADSEIIVKDNTNYFSQIFELLKNNIDDVSTLDEMIPKIYNFYAEQGVELSEDLLKIENSTQVEKENNLIKILEIGTGVSGIENILFTLKDFYENQN